MPDTPFLILGHRGLPGSGAENSLGSVGSALEAGCDGVEVDVRSSADGHLVLGHDPTHAGLQIETHTLAELRAAGAIDTLPDLLARFPDAHVNVEIKAPLRDQRALVSGLSEVVLASGPERVLVSSFYLPVLADLRPHGLRLGVLTATWYDPDGSVAVSQATSVGASVALPHDGSVGGPTLFAAATSAGLEVIVWTVNDAARAASLRDWGAAGVITDDPGVLLGGLG